MKPVFVTINHRQTMENNINKFINFIPSGYVFKCLNKKIPEFLNGVYFYPFIRRMGRTDGRTERYHIEPGINTADNPAFKSCMNSFYFRHFAEFLIVNIFHDPEDD